MRALLIVAATIAALVLAVLAVFVALPDCQFEDSLNCVWGNDSGNAVGMSYVTLSNDTFFLQINLSE